MEHDFYCLNVDEVQDFADVILLFIRYTDKYLFGIESDCELMDDEIEENNEPIEFLRLYINLIA